MKKFNTHGGYFAPNGYFRIDEGGSHEENPNGGVQVGVDANGIPNVLEEGEPVYNDYVYSDNIYADGGILEKYNIPAKYAGKLYSKIADAFVDEAEERPNDPISNNGLNAMLVRLADAQEEQKARAQQKELEDELANMTPEELDELEAMLVQQEAANQQVSQEEAAIQEQAMQQPVALEDMSMEQQPVAEVPQQPMMMSCGGKMHKFAPGGMLIDPPARTNVSAQRDNTATIFTGTSTGLPNEEPTPEQIEAARQGQRIDNTILSFIPVVGTPYALMNASDEYNSGNHGAAALETAAAIPFVGPLLKGLKAGRKVVKAAKAYTKASNALADAERAANKVSKLEKAGKDITSAKVAADKLADEAIDAMVKSEDARRVASGIASTTKKVAKSSGKGKDLTSHHTWAGEIIRSIEPSYNARRAYAMAKEAGKSKTRQVVNTVAKSFVGVPQIAGITYLTGKGAGNLLNRYNSNQFANSFDSADWLEDSPVGKYSLGGPINTFATGGDYDDPPQHINPSYYFGQIPYMTPLMRGTLYRQPNGQNGLIGGTRVVNGVPGQVPMRPIDNGRRWYTYRPGDRIVWGANVSGVDRARIYDGIGDNANATTKSATVASKPARVPIIPLQAVERPNLINEYDSLLEEHIPNQAELAIEESRARLADRVKDMPIVSTGTNSSSQTNGDAQEGDSAYPVWPRYAGLVSAGLRGLWNTFQRPDRYNIPRFRPVLPDGRMDLIDPIYNPIDENMAVNDVLNANARTVYGLQNSGLGPSTGAALLAADYNAGRNIGNARTQVWDANNQRRNQVIGLRNANGQTLGQFRYGINQNRAGILNNAALVNQRNDLLNQRLNYAAEQDKANAVNSSIDALSEGMAGIGRENFALNQINLNDALDYMLRNGYDVTYKGKRITRNGGKLKKK